VGDLSATARQRLALYGGALVVVYALVLLGAAWMRLWLLQPDGSMGAGDFIAFWSAGRMALEGRAADAYDWALHKAVQVAVTGADFPGHFAWHNPPHYFLYVIPFALPSYPLGWALWVAASFAGFALALRLVVPGWLVPPLLAAPATLWCMSAGQNGFLTAALMAGCLAWQSRRPAAAGLLLGLLTYKPQFGLFFPALLALERRWAVFAAAAATTLALAGLALLAFGSGTWLAFLDSLGRSGEALARGGSAWSKLQSAYALAFQATGDLRLAMIAQGALVAALAVLLAWLWWRDAPLAPRAAALVAASYLATPYAYIYDAPVLTVAAAFLLADGLARGFGRALLPLLVLGLLLPGAFLAIGSLAGFGGAVVLLAAAVLRARVRR
jgi:hypothetical protein